MRVAMQVSLAAGGPAQTRRWLWNPSPAAPCAVHTPRRRGEIGRVVANCKPDRGGGSAREGPLAGRCNLDGNWRYRVDTLDALARATTQPYPEDIDGHPNSFGHRTITAEVDGYINGAEAMLRQ